MNRADTEERVLMRRIENESGVALAVAIFALVVIGALVAGALFVGMQEQRVGLNTVKSQQAFSAAQEGAHITVANWSTGSYNGLAVGDSADISGSLADGTGWYRGKVRRLNNELFLVESEGFSADDATRQAVGLLVRLRPIEININSALKTQGAIKIGGSSQINGYDTPPAGWGGCPATEPPLPGIRVDDPSLISTSGCGDLSCVSGVPKVEQDTTISDSTLTTFGDATFDDLVALATKTIPGGNRKIEPSILGGVCNTSNPDNWGDPLNPTSACGNYFPIIFSTADLTINGVQGQGVLVVDGNLSVQGGFEFYGPVIVKGTLKTTGTGGHFNGGVIAANVNLEQSTVLGDAVVNFSSCALIKALTASASGSLMAERSWVNLY
ncbi:MAG: hypothetical protein ACE5PT_02150 [Gemmatimonadales bacterium]